MTYFPWPQYAHPWDMDVGARLPEGSGVELAVDDVAKRIIVQPEAAWSSITLSFVASTEEAIEIGATVDVYVLLSAPRTNARVPVMLHGGEGKYTGEVTLERALLGGVIDMAAQVVTSNPVRLVGSSEPWSLVVDPGEAPPRHGIPPIDVEWVGFSDDAAPAMARKASDSYAVVDVTGLKPVLLLNEDVEGFKQLMMAKKPQLERRRLQAVLGSSLARLTTASLVREAQARIIENDDATFDAPSEPLYRQVLEALAKELESVGDIQDLCATLGDPSSMGPVDRAQLWAEIDNAIDRLTDHAESVASAVKGARFV